MLRVLMPPEFEYLSGLFLPDLIRARLAGKIASMVADFDPGSEGKTAREQAQNLEGEVLVVGAHSDLMGAKILERAIKEAGCQQVTRLMAKEEGENILKAVGGKSKGTPSSYLMFQGHWGFVEEKDCLIRKTPGKAGSIPLWVKKIFLLKEDRMPDQWEENAIYAFTFLSPNDLNSSWLNRCAGIIDAVGPEFFRLAHLNPQPCSNLEWGGAFWAGKYGLHVPAFTRFLRELTQKHLPHQAGLLETVMGYYQLGVDPFEEIYDSNGLIDRNQELIVNIVP